MRVLRILAFPFSLLYALVVHLRNLLYDWRVFSSQRLKIPIICIGNLSTGGTGKTPMVSFLVDVLGKDYQIAILSRGYRRKTRGFVMASEKSTAEELGDEPYQIYRKHPSLSVAVDIDRQRGIEILQERIDPDVIILDDAFQHRKVTASFSMLLTSYESLYVHDWYLPTGNLRDAKNQSRRADIIIVTKCPKQLSVKERETIEAKLKPKPYQNVIFGTLEYADKLVGTNGKITLQGLHDQKMALVTGIANPEPLIAHLKTLHLDFKHFKYADHHYFSNDDIAKFSEYDVVVTTEKDFVRMTDPPKNTYYLAVAHKFSDCDTILLKNKIEKMVRPHSAP